MNPVTPMKNQPTGGFRNREHRFLEQYRETLRGDVGIETFLAQAIEDNRKRMAELTTQVRGQLREWHTREIQALRNRSPR